MTDGCQSVGPGEDAGKLGKGFRTTASYEPHHMIEAAIRGRRLWAEEERPAVGEACLEPVKLGAKASIILGSAAFMACGLNSRPENLLRSSMKACGKAEPTLANNTATAVLNRLRSAHQPNASASPQVCEG